MPGRRSSRWDRHYPPADGPADPGQRPRLAGRPGATTGSHVPPNPPGAHFLTDRRLIAGLVRASGVGPGDLVLDLGAGYGALTGPTATTGARVLAIERDPALARRLRQRFDANPLVTVVEEDLRWVRLPGRPFYVLASPPFALTTLLLRRLLGDRRSRLAGADLIVQWGAARGLTEARSRNRENARWAASFELVLMRRIPAGSFAPPPSCAAAHLRVRPRRSQPAASRTRPATPAAPETQVVTGAAGARSRTGPSGTSPRSPIAVSRSQMVSSGASVSRWSLSQESVNFIGPVLPYALRPPNSVGISSGRKP